MEQCSNFVNIILEEYMAKPPTAHPTDVLMDLRRLLLTVFSRRGLTLLLKDALSSKNISYKDIIILIIKITKHTWADT